jgi:coenzyme F420 biosynthesis associated uncharacterized protein
LSESGGLVDWRLAERVAAGIAGGLGGSSADPDAPTQEAVTAACAEALSIAAAHTGLGRVTDPPAPELIDRREWATTALTTLALASEPLQRGIEGDMGLPGPLGGLARRALRAGAGLEAGVAVGYVARNVLGQYDLALFGPSRPSRLLFVAENMASVQRRLEAEPELFLHWVALHETTHVVQLERVPWLAGHLRELAAELLEGAARGLDGAGLRELGRSALRDPRALVRSLLRGELTRLLADPELRCTLDRLQAAMSVIEGHAEHVMDSASPELGPGIAELRERLDERRSSRGGLRGVLGRLLGIDLKLQQYALGKAFCDRVVAEADAATLRSVWDSPQALPTLAELEQPQLWLERTGGAAPLPA